MAGRWGSKGCSLGGGHATGVVWTSWQLRTPKITDTERAAGTRVGVRAVSVYLQGGVFFFFFLFFLLLLSLCAGTACSLCGDTAGAPGCGYTAGAPACGVWPGPLGTPLAPLCVGYTAGAPVCGTPWAPLCVG